MLRRRIMKTQRINCPKSPDAISLSDAVIMRVVATGWDASNLLPHCTPQSSTVQPRLRSSASSPAAPAFLASSVTLCCPALLIARPLHRAIMLGAPTVTADAWLPWLTPAASGAHPLRSSKRNVQRARSLLTRMACMSTNFFRWRWGCVGHWSMAAQPRHPRSSRAHNRVLPCILSVNCQSSVTSLHFTRLGTITWSTCNEIVTLCGMLP